MGNVERCDKTLPLNEMIFYVRRDAALRERWLTDLEGLAREFGLSRAEYEAVRDKDVRRLHELGVHQYYVPQILRLFYGAVRATRNAHPGARGLQARVSGGGGAGDGAARPSSSGGSAEPWPEIVAAMAMTHSPGLTGWFDARARGAPDAGARGDRRDARAARGRAARRASSLFSNDHLLNWPINNTPEYTVGIARRARGARPTGTTSGSALDKYRDPRPSPRSRATSSTRARGGARVLVPPARCSSTTASPCRCTT